MLLTRLFGNGFLGCRSRYHRGSRKTWRKATRGNRLTQSQQFDSPVESFLGKVIEAFPFDQSLSVLVLTHLLPDRPTFLAALGKIVAISRIVAIPYSINRDVQNTVAKSYRVDLFTLEEMEVGEVLIEAFSQDMQKLKSPMAIMEIGGYYARFGNRLRTTYGERFW